MNFATQAGQGFPELRGDIGAAFEGLSFGPYGSERSDILDFTSNLFTQIRTPQQSPGQNFLGFNEPGATSGLRGAFLTQGEGGGLPSVGGFGGGGGVDDGFTNIYGANIAPGSGGAPPGTGEFLLRQFEAQDRQALLDYYAGLAAPPPPFFGGGGGGGLGGGLNFPKSEPADPRFWLDMVRWLIQ